MIPVPRRITFEPGLMRFESLVTVTAERDTQILIRDLLIIKARKVAHAAGFQFNGDRKVDRVPTVNPDIVLYRLTVPVCPEGEGLR